MNENPEQKYTYLEIWGLRRRAGFLAVTIRTSMYAYVLLVFLRICYAFYIHSLAFTTKDGLILIIPAFIIGTIVWVVNEIVYKTKMKD